MLLGATPVQAGEAAVTAHLQVSPLLVALDMSATTIKVGQGTTALAIATNVSSDTLRSVTLTVRFEPVGLSSRGATSVLLKPLKGGRSGEASFRLCATAVGSYLVLAQAEHAGATIESPARLLVVVEGRPAKC
jgi:hypothetical protein